MVNIPGNYDNYKHIIMYNQTPKQMDQIQNK